MSGSFNDLQEFLAALEKDGDLARIKAPVDPHLEVTGILARVLREQGPASPRTLAGTPFVTPSAHC